MKKLEEAYAKALITIFEDIQDTGNINRLVMLSEAAQNLIGQEHSFFEWMKEQGEGQGSKPRVPVPPQASPKMKQ